MERLLTQLTERLTGTFGTRLVSVILYGSAASGEYDGEFSDLNVLCVLSRVTTTELKDSEPVFRWWRQLGHPAPLLLSEEEVRSSTDCFAIEFHDIREHRKVLAGIDVIEGLEIDNSFYRAQVEYELRAKLLRLRQKAAGVLHDRDMLCRLLADSVSTFCMLFRHALRIAGHPTPITRTAILDEAERRFGIDQAPLAKVLALREKRVSPKSANPVDLFESYLAQIGKVITAVDRIEKQ
ncbi:MAG: hypothetical protein HY235_23255 [Acidobacteria bacterium]|nr:hypothetical protein [Acidobacteriota bacterium]